MVASCTMEYHSKSMVFFCFIGQFDEILYETKSSIKIKIRVAKTVMLNRYNLIIDTKDWGIKMQAMDKVERVLGIYTKLINGAVVNKTQTANEYGVNERSIQRDIDDIRNYLELEAEKEGVINNVIYDRTAKGYKLEQIYHLKFTNPEILAICKILLDSRAFTKKRWMICSRN